MTLQGPLWIFLVGAAGGVALELLHLYSLRHTRPLPDYVRSKFYWAVSILMMVLGGGLALAYFGATEVHVLAVGQMGLSTPLILQKLATTFAPGTSPPPTPAGSWTGDITKTVDSWRW